MIETLASAMRGHCTGSHSVRMCHRDRADSIQTSNHSALQVVPSGTEATGDFSDGFFPLDCPCCCMLKVTLGCSDILTPASLALMRAWVILSMVADISIYSKTGSCFPT